MAEKLSDLVIDKIAIMDRYKAHPVRTRVYTSVTIYAEANP